MSKKLGEIWLRLGHGAVKTALAESDGKITPQTLPQILKNIKATLEGHLEKNEVALKFVAQNIGYHAEAWAKTSLKEFIPRNKPYRADWTDEEWLEIVARTDLKNSIKADKKLPRETLTAKCQAELTKAGDMRPGESMDEAAQDREGFTVEDILHEVDELLALVKIDDRRDDHRDAAE